MKFVVADYESFYDRQHYSVMTLGTEAYIRDKRFEAHGCAIKWDKDKPAVWFNRHQLKDVFARIDWSDTFLVHHHAQFDGLINSHHYGFTPRMYGCTLSMARLMLGNHLSVSLEQVRKHFDMPGKTTPYDLFNGKKWDELSPAVQQQVGAGACDEVESIWIIFQKLMAMGFPPEELEVVDQTIKMFTNPVMRADVDMLGKIWEGEAARKQQCMAALNVTAADLNSSDRFAQLLRDEGEEPETKEGKNGPIYAFAKTDPYMRDYLLEHDNERIRTLAEARLGAKSTIMQTRAETLGWMASRGPLCVYLNYAGAGTLRPSGGDGSNFLNLKRRSPIRPALLAPEGYLLAPADSSQIECVAEDELVLTNNGSKAIQDVKLNDLVWDGVEWVEHEGVICKGKKQVIRYQGLTATPEHVVYVRGDSGEEKMEMRFAAALARNLVKTDPTTPVCEAPLRQSYLRRLQNLRRERHQIQIQIGARLCSMGCRTFATQKLYWSGDRSNRQRWSLRTWKFAVIDAAHQCQQSLYNFLGSNEARPAGNAGFQTHIPSVRLWARSNKTLSRTRFDGGTNYIALQKRSLGNYGAIPAEEKRPVQTEEKKVYDIINAGPRHRFTVSGVLVSNCRVAHYLAGGPDEPVIQKFRDGADPYVDIASQFYGETIYKPKQGDPRYEEMEAKRGLGKQGRLMCAYGASGKQFKMSAKNGLYGPPVDISIEDSMEFVKIYRDTNPSICAPQTGYWAQCSRMLSRLAGGDPLDWGPLHVRNHRIYLPNGCPLIYDTLHYHVPNEEERANLKEHEHKGYWRVKTRYGWKTMWGSKLTQNICEAVSRVIISQAMIRLSRLGYRALNWPYDELLFYIPNDGRTEQHVEIIKTEMKREPIWLPGLPLDCEVNVGERYSK